MNSPDLNPILQRKLIRYLAAHTSNQYFITTHSAVLMDVPDAEIYHIRLVNGASVVERVTSGRQKSAVCEDLDYHPSDLLQANCIIWVEGPSDRIYLNWWLQSIDEDLVEGIHYSIMFYGGRLLAHLSNAEIDQQHVDDFISLRRLNNRGVILIDSDRRDEDSDINATKQRLQGEFDSRPGHAWITKKHVFQTASGVDESI
ncbi:MAG: ATP-dependent nuclease [Candidatus Electrothrix sp. YB6]